MVSWVFMLPLFKTHYSVGKSLLTLKPAKDPTTEKIGATSLLDICVENNLSTVTLVEDSLIGFLEAKKQFDAINVNLVFGLRLSLCTDMSHAPAKGDPLTDHKIIVFAKNGEGCLLLNKLYSFAQTKGFGRIDSEGLKSFYNESLLLIAIPFYDSFLFNNAFVYDSCCLLDHSFFSPLLFLENNLLPFDLTQREMVTSYSSKYSLETLETKSVYYENRSDFEAYQTYKCICSRTPGRSKTLDMPNLDHCGSPEFCFESYLENESA